jgi:hypothetical protein
VVAAVAAAVVKIGCDGGCFRLNVDPDMVYTGEVAFESCVAAEPLVGETAVETDIEAAFENCLAAAAHEDDTVVVIVADDGATGVLAGT